MTNLKKEITENGIHYTLQGDYYFGSSRFIVEREARNSNDGQAIVERRRATKESLCGIVCFLLCQPFSQRLISL